MNILNTLDLTMRALGVQTLEVDPQRCIVTRYRASSCRRCAAVCPSEAITPTPTLDVDADKCTRCGACAVACPTGALDLPLPRAALRDGLRAGKTIIACVRADLSGREETGLRVECLGCVGSTDLLLAWHAGAGLLELVDGGCADCPSAKAVTELPVAIAATEAIIAAPAMTVLRLTSVDPDSPVEEPGCGRANADKASRAEGGDARSAGPILSRRQLLLFFGLRSARVTTTSMKKQGSLVESLHSQKPPPFSHQLLMQMLAEPSPIDGSKRIASFEAESTHGTTETVNGDSRGQTGLLESLHVASVRFSNACDTCGLCVRYCPHGALRTAEGGLVVDPRLCTACGLCVEVCPPEAVTLESPGFSRGAS